MARNSARAVGRSVVNAGRGERSTSLPGVIVGLSSRSQSRRVMLFVNNVLCSFHYTVNASLLMKQVMNSIQRSRDMCAEGCAE